MKPGQLIPLLVLAGVIGTAAELSAQASLRRAVVADLMAVDLVEVRDEIGRAVLRGQFSDDRDQRYAALGPAGDDGDAAGEVEIDAGGIEVTIRNVRPHATFTLALDGAEMAVMTSDAKGRSRLKLRG